MRRRTDIGGAMLAASVAAVVAAAAVALLQASPAAAAGGAARGLLPVPLPTSSTTTAAPAPTPRLTQPPATSLPTTPVRPVAPRPGQPAAAPGTGSSESANQTLTKYMTHHDDPTFRVGAHTVYVEHCRSAHCAHSSVTINTKYDGVVTYEFYVDVPPSPTPSR